MDRTTWLTIVILWAACACQLSEADHGCPPKSCYSHSECPPRTFCAPDMHCKRCLCGRTHECRWNAVLNEAYCDCDHGRHGEYCECNKTGCGACADPSSFVSTCSDYGNQANFNIYNNRKLDFQANNVPSGNPTTKPNVIQCRDHCASITSCNVFEFRIGGNGNCKTYFMATNFIESRANVIDNSQFKMGVRQCLTC